jgi:hypothetical protein
LIKAGFIGSLWSTAGCQKRRDRECLSQFIRPLDYFFQQISKRV